MKRFIKDLAWKVPIAIMWGIAADFPFSKFSIWGEWGEMLAWLFFYWGLDAIRWGLKED